MIQYMSKRHARLGLFFMVLSVLWPGMALGAQAASKPMAAPYDHPVLKMWQATTKAPGYAKATAHDPHYEDAAVWPKELQMDGPPAYMGEKWEPARLLIWNRRDPDERTGGQVDIMDPANWLENGKPAEDPPDYDADVVFPDGAKPYFVLCSQGNREQRDLRCRHLTVGNNARVSVFGCGPKGNWWVKKGGSIYERHGGRFLGEGHAFARNDNVPAYRPGLGFVRPAEWSEEQAPLLQEISQYIHVQKAGGSLEAVGNWSTQDQFHIDAGTFIVGPLSAVGTGRRASLVVHGEGVLQLQSGGAIAKNIDQTFNTDVFVEGVLQAGSPQRPIRRDAVVGLSAKDYVGEVDSLRNYRERLGLRVKGDGRILVHRAEGSDARLVLAWHGIDLSVLRDQPPKPDHREYPDWQRAMAGAPHMPRTITLDFPESLQLELVAFDDLRLGGIKGVSAAQVADWKDIQWRDGNQGPVEQLIATCDWYDNIVSPDGWPTVAIPQGQPLMLELLSPLKNVKVCYTTDGTEPTARSMAANGPVQIEKTTTVLARAFVEGRPQGGIFRVDCLSRDVPLPAVNAPGGPDREGLSFIAGAWRAKEDGSQGRLEGKQEGSPPTRGVVATVSAKPSDANGADGNRAVDLVGFIHAPADGVYELSLSIDTAPQAELFLDGYRLMVIDNRGKIATATIALAKGPHALELRHRRAWWGSTECRLEWKTPGTPGTPVATEAVEVPASALSHGDTQ